MGLMTRMSELTVFFLSVCSSVGVPQGTKVTPLLWLLFYVIDLAAQKLNVGKYADDTVFYKFGKTHGSEFIASAISATKQWSD